MIHHGVKENQQKKLRDPVHLSLNLLQCSDFLNSPSFTFSLNPESIFPVKEIQWKLEDSICDWTREDGVKLIIVSSSHSSDKLYIR